MKTLLHAVALASALSIQTQTPRDLTPAMRTEVIERLLEALKSSYVFPDVAVEIELAVRAHAAAKDYDALVDPRLFAQLLTEHVREINDDRHLRVEFSAEVQAARANDREPTREELDQRATEEANRNFGFESVRRLAGNVGYLDLRGFMPPEIAAPTAHAALGFLANADALIVDLRENGGGHPAMVQLLCSYFFGPEPVHLNDLYFRPEDRTDEFWTLKELPGERLVQQPLFVLTSAYTFSAAEEFAYNLQALKRATIVGETTGGGAHPGGPHRLTDHFRVFVPSGRAINPITKTNWEGVGVKPEVVCSAPVALARAHVLAVEQLLANEKNARERARLETALAAARTDLNSVVQTR